VTGALDHGPIVVADHGDPDRRAVDDRLEGALGGGPQHAVREPLEEVLGAVGRDGYLGVRAPLRLEQVRALGNPDRQKVV
jgi:hypothetical protein